MNGDFQALFREKIGVKLHCVTRLAASLTQPKMTEAYPNPWDFHNTDKKLVSADHYHKVVYHDLNEIAMGAPIGGQCFLETPDNKKLLIHDWCGGPAAWETEGQLVAIPIWTRKILKGTIQQIGVLDIKNRELKIYKKTFSVLDIRSFDKTIIYGYDSPMHKTKTIIFNTEKEKIAKLIKLNHEHYSKVSKTVK